MLEKTEGSTKKGQSKDTGNIEHTRHRTKAIKPQSTAQHRKLKKGETWTSPTTEGKLRCSRRVCRK